MDNIPQYIYVWAAYHVILISAFIIRYRANINAVSDIDNYAGFTKLFYYSQKIFRVLATSVIMYLIIFKWGFKWQFDDWWLEALLVFITFCSGHLIFIAIKSPPKVLKFRKLYIVISIAFIASFYIRLVLAIIGGYSMNPQSIAYFLPDIRQGDAHIFDNYYLGYSEIKDIVIEKKVFLFRKDLVYGKDLSPIICYPKIYSFTQSDESSIDIPFPFVVRTADSVCILVNPAHDPQNGKIVFKRGASGELSVSGYQYKFIPNNTTPNNTTPIFSLCGKMNIK